MGFSAATVAPAASAATAASAAAPFQAALLNTLSELTFIKGKIAAGSEPWKSAFAQVRKDGLASLSYTPKPRETVECGYHDDPSFGCNDERNDSKAAYTHALLWILTGDEKHAAKSAEILDAWSAKLKRHTNDNAPLQAGWTGSVFPRAAIILRATYPAWGAARQRRFSAMLDTAFFPLIRNGSGTRNGNWELSYIEALVAGGVFNGDTAVYNRGVFLWRKRVPAYFYLKSDGALPVRPYGENDFDNPGSLVNRWYNPKAWPDGLSQETCRDLGHVQLGLAGMINTAEIAWHQGLDLYSGTADRIVTAMEFHAGLLLGGKAPAGLCGDVLSGVKVGATWEIAYNHFHNRMGRDLPLTRKLILDEARPTGTSTHMAWETLTHAELGAITGLQAPRPGTARGTGNGTGAELALRGNGLIVLRNGRAYSLRGKRMDAEAGNLQVYQSSRLAARPE